MYYVIQQTCLAVAIILLMLLSSDWLKALSPMLNKILAVVFGFSAIAGILMAMLAERRRIEKKKEE